MEAHIGLGTDTRPNGVPIRAALMRDERLAWQVGRGSERAFAALYDRYHQPLYRYCRSMLRDDSDAQDALQSTFAGAFAALRQGRRDAPLRPWLFRIAHNEAISILRRRRPHGELPDALPARMAGVEEQAEHHERLRHLVGDLRELPERQRAALLMRELNGLSHEEIALALESSVGTAKQTIYEARRGLAEFEEGRMTSCDEICRTVSNGDRRALRGRRVRAHLRDCKACSTFAAAIPARSADLRALAPAMPPAATAAVLGHLLAGGIARTGGGGGGAVGATAGAAGKATVAVGGAKVATTVAVAVTATIGVATALGPQHALRTHARSSAVSGALRSTAAHHSGKAALGGAAARSHTGSWSGSGAGRSAHAGRHGSATQAGVPRQTRSATGASGRRTVGHAQVTSTRVRAPGAHGSPPAASPGTPISAGSGTGQGGDHGAAAGGQPPPEAAPGQGQGAAQGQGQGQNGNPGNSGSGNPHRSGSGTSGSPGSDAGDSHGAPSGHGSHSGSGHGASPDNSPLSVHADNPVALLRHVDPPGAVGGSS